MITWKLCRNGENYCREALGPGGRLTGMKRSPTSKFLHETVHFLLGLVALAALTALCFWLDFRLVSAAAFREGRAIAFSYSTKV
jgi:hypothetical protein